MNALPKIRSLSELVRALERGDLDQDSREVLGKINTALVERGEGTATLTLGLTFTAKDGMVEVKSKLASKLPEPKRKRSILWVGADHVLQLNDPRQGEMSFVDVNAREETRVAD